MSVCGTVTYGLALEVFLGRPYAGIESTVASSSADLLALVIRICLDQALRQATGKPIPAPTWGRRPPIGNHKQCWNIDQLIHRLRPHYTGLALGPTNPGSICVAQETLGLRWAGFSPAFLLLMPTFSLP